MGESTDSSSLNPSKFVTGEVRRIKGYWGERFAFLENYTNIFFVPEKPLPKWSDSDFEEFIASDPIHGPPLKSARKVAEIAATGSVIGAVSTAGLAWKYSKSPHGAALAFGAGAIFGWTFGQEIASHWFQLYRMDTMAAQIEFLDWWKNKSGVTRAEFGMASLCRIRAVDMLDPTVYVPQSKDQAAACKQWTPPDEVAHFLNSSYTAMCEKSDIVRFDNPHRLMVRVRLSGEQSPDSSQS